MKLHIIQNIVLHVEIFTVMGTVTVMQVILVHSLRAELFIFIGLSTKPRMNNLLKLLSSP